MSLIENLQWRYATKKYDSSKKVTQEDIEFIKEAVRLSASSFGLQPYKVLEVSNPQLREKLRAVSANQSQVTDASHLFVFCNKTLVTDEEIDQEMRLRASINEGEAEKLVRYGEFLKNSMKKMSALEMYHWTAKQTYLALATAVAACAELKIDCSPMEGFSIEKYNEILNSPAQGLSAATLLAVGYRHTDDQAQHLKKVRKPVENLFEVVS